MILVLHVSNTSRKWCTLLQEAADATESIREEFENGGAAETKYIQKVNRCQAGLTEVCT